MTVASIDTEQESTEQILVKLRKILSEDIHFRDSNASTLSQLVSKVSIDIETSDEGAGDVLLGTIWLESPAHNASVSKRKWAFHIFQKENIEMAEQVIKRLVYYFHGVTISLLLMQDGQYKKIA